MSETASSALISLRTALIIVIIGVLSFSSLFVLLAFAPDLQDKNYAGPHAYSKSALGYNFSAELLKETGFDVRMSRNPDLLQDVDDDNLLVLTPGGDYHSDDLEALETNRYGLVLIVLPKRMGLTSFTDRRRQSNTELLPTADVQRLLSVIDADLKVSQIPAVSSLSFDGEDWPVQFQEVTQVITDGPVLNILSSSEGTVFGRVSGTNVFILSDPELMNTHGLSSLDNSVVMLELFDAHVYSKDDVAINFDTTIHGFERTRNLLRLVFEPPLLGATLFAFATAILLGWTAFVRFGKLPNPEPALKAGRTTLINSTAGLFSQTQREAGLAADYGKLVERQTINDLGYSEDMNSAQTDRILQQLINTRSDDAGKAVTPPDASSVKTSGQLVNFAKAYHQWKRNMKNGAE